jgi:mevalonate kinase
MEATPGPVSAHAGGKVILLGEHAVVHGEPAIVAGLPAGVTVRVTPRPGPGTEIAATGGLDDPRLARAVAEARALAGIEAERGLAVEIAGDLPVAVGLGSSAALCVALVRALEAASGRVASDDDVARNAHRLEGIFHGTPSGVDGTAATYGGLLWFEAGPPPRHHVLRPARAFDVVVVLSGSRHETGRTVAGLRERAAASPRVYRPVLGAIGALVRAAREAIEGGELELLGELMTMNHGLLRACGVSTAELDAIVEDALAEGARGAKLTGAGGGGAVIALPAGEPAALAGAMQARGHECFAVALAPRS